MEEKEVEGEVIYRLERISRFRTNFINTNGFEEVVITLSSFQVRFTGSEDSRLIHIAFAITLQEAVF